MQCDLSGSGGLLYFISDDFRILWLVLNIINECWEPMVGIQ